MDRVRLNGIFLLLTIHFLDANYFQSKKETYENWKWFAEKYSDGKYWLNDDKISLSQTEAISCKLLLFAVSICNVNNFTNSVISGSL